MVSFCDWFKSKRRRRRGEKRCCGAEQEEEKLEGERRIPAAAPEEEKAKGNDDEEEEEEEEEEEGEKIVESPPLPSEEEEPEGNGGDGEKEGDGENKVEGAPSAPLPPAEEKPKGGNGKKAKKQGGKQEKKKGNGEKENRTKEPPSPPEEIELCVPMHCEGCARKIRCILKRYEGVAEVAADWRAQKVVVKGQKAAASPLKVVEHLERETDKKVQLLTPLPPPQPAKKKPKAQDQLKKKQKEEEEEEEVEADKKEEINVVASFKLQMHRQACAQKIAKKKDESGDGANLSGDQEKEEDANIVEGEDAEDEMIDKSSGESEEMIATKVVEEEATLKVCCRSCSSCQTRYPPNVCPLCGGGGRSFYPAQEYPAIVFPHIFSDENPNACYLM